MIRRIAKFAKRKSVIGFSLVAVTGTIIGTQVYKPVTPTKYVLSTVSRGTLVTTVSGSGQVSAENQIDITPKVSGTIQKVLVTLGEEVNTDTALVAIEQKDASKSVRNAQQSVRDAQISLESAQIAYDKLVKPQSNAALLQAQDAVSQAQRSLAKLQAPPDAIDVMNAQAKVDQAEQDAKLAADGKTPKTVRDAYDDSVNTLNSMVVTLQKSLDDSNDVLAVEGTSGNINFTNLFSVLDQGKKILAYSSYPLAKDTTKQAHDAVLALAVRDEDMTKIDAARALVKTALDANQTLLDAVRAGLDASLTSSSFSQSSLDQYKSTIQGDSNSIINGYATLKTLDDNIQKAQDAYDNAQTSLAVAQAELAKLMAGTDADQIAQAKETLAERTQALADVKVGADAIDLKVALNTIEQRKSALTNAQSSLQDAIDTINDYTVRSPIAGVVAKVSAKEANQASPSSAVATVITKSKIAGITLSEVDVSKVKVGQKTMLTFDAVPDLTISGTVAEVDLIGTASQGVVSYGVKIAFDTQDDRIKAGMSVSASVITDTRVNVLLVPNGAIKQVNGVSTVQTLTSTASDAEAAQGVTSATPPETKQVETGLANDQSTEITSGLNEGDRIVTRTIAAGTTAAKTTTASTSARSASFIPGIGGGPGR